MRFLASIAIAVVLLGGVAWCQQMMTRQIDFDITRSAHSHAGNEDESSKHSYRLEIVPSFAGQSDPFALRTGEDADTARLSVRHGGRTLLDRSKDFDRGEKITVPKLDFAGEELELHIEATPSIDAAQNPCALRVRLYRDDGALCDEATLWTEGGGAIVSSSVVLSLSPQRESVDRGLGERS